MNCRTLPFVTAGLLSLAAGPTLADHGALSPGQLEAAERVYVGEAECEFKQRISLHRIDAHPGQFMLRFKKSQYTLVPKETTTGAVRLEDERAGVVWIQIPAKSMLLNARLGQRLVDACLHAEQRAELEAERQAQAAGEGQPTGIGVAQAPAPAPATTAR